MSARPMRLRVKSMWLAADYDDMKMEPAFVKDEVEEAVHLIKQKGEAAFAELRKRSSEFIFQDTYVWVASAKGVELVNPAFPKLEGRNLWDLKDSKGRIHVARGSKFDQKARRGLATRVNGPGRAKAVLATLFPI
jgi:signal transduction histidine kinase